MDAMQADAVYELVVQGFADLGAPTLKCVSRSFLLRNLCYAGQVFRCEELPGRLADRRRFRRVLRRSGEFGEVGQPGCRGDEEGGLTALLGSSVADLLTHEFSHRRCILDETAVKAPKCLRADLKTLHRQLEELYARAQRREDSVRRRIEGKRRARRLLRRQIDERC